MSRYVNFEGLIRLNLLDGKSLGCTDGDSPDNARSVYGGRTSDGEEGSSGPQYPVHHSTATVRVEGYDHGLGLPPELCKIKLQLGSKGKESISWTRVVLWLSRSGKW